MGNFLTAPTYLTYGSFTFNSTADTSVEHVPVEDEAKRVLVGYRVNISATQFLQNNSGTDNDVNNAKSQLQKDGLALTFYGSGPLSVNVASSRDLSYGPHVQYLRIKNLGGGNAVRIMWGVTVFIPACLNGQSQNRIMAFNWSRRITTDAEGLQTVTTTGYWEIPATRISGGASPTVTDSADAYTDAILGVFPLIPGWMHKIDRSLSLDKRRMDFTVTDTQPAGFMPPGCISADGSQSVENLDTEWADASTRFGSTISAEYVLAPGFTLVWALRAFQALCSNRMGWAQSNAAPASTSFLGNLFGVASKPNALLTHFKAHPRFHKGANRIAFTASFWFLSSLNDCLATSGIYNAVPMTDPSQWTASLANVLSPRGSTGLITRAVDDSLVGLCETGVPRASIGSSAPAAPPVVATPLGDMSPPDPDSSWLKSELDVKVVRESNLVRHKPLPPSVPSSQQGMGSAKPATTKTIGPDGTISVVPISEVQWATQTSAGRLLNEQPTPPDIIQQRVAASYKVIFRGLLIRAGYPIQTPKLVQYGGVNCVPGYQECTENKVIHVTCGVPILATMFYFEYCLSEAPDNSQLPIFLPNSMAS